MALPMYVFYEVGIISAGFFNKKKPPVSETAVAPVTAAGGKAMSPAMSGAADSDYVGVPTGSRRR